MNSFFSNPSNHNKISINEANTSLSNDIFPGDIMMDILSRLSAELLSKFRCISPSWNNLVFDSPFVTMQSHRNFSNPKTRLMLVDSKSCVYSLDCQNPYSKPVQLHPQNHCKFNKIVGSCNGLLCLESSRWGDHSLIRDLYIWNPTTNACNKLPKLEDPSHSRSYGFYCVTVNPTVKDCRVLIITRKSNFRDRNNSKSDVVIYSNNSWRDLASSSIPCSYIQHPVGVLVGGFLYWSINAHKPLISFDIVHEKFGETELPSTVPYFNQEPEPLVLGEYKGKLCVLYESHRFTYERHRKFMLWVTKDYGDKPSWTMLFTGSVVWENIVPFKCITKNVFVFLKRVGYGSSSELLVYDPKEEGKRQVFCSQTICRVASYVDSLESV